MISVLHSSAGTLLNKFTMSKETKKQSSGNLMFCNCSTSCLVFFNAKLGLKFKRFTKFLLSHFANLWIGEPMQETTGLRGISSRLFAEGFL